MAGVEPWLVGASRANPLSLNDVEAPHRTLRESWHRSCFETKHGPLPGRNECNTAGSPTLPGRDLPAGFARLESTRLCGAMRVE